MKPSLEYSTRGVLTDERKKGCPAACRHQISLPTDTTNRPPRVPCCHDGGELYAEDFAKFTKKVNEVDHIRYHIASSEKENATSTYIARRTIINGRRSGLVDRRMHSSSTTSVRGAFRDLPANVSKISITSASLFSSSVILQSSSTS